MAYIKKKIWPCQTLGCKKEGRYEVINEKMSGAELFVSNVLNVENAN